MFGSAFTVNLVVGPVLALLLWSGFTI
ncbi:Protein of unknown function [Propionibacterium freudenreichii]|nr:Protein of unknown function [Propionibacterium freudenreichii]